MTNPMRDVRIEKITLNIGAGKDQAKLEKGIKLLKNITGVKPVKTFTNKRIPEWGLRPGLPIGCKITLRKRLAKEVLARLLAAKDNSLKETQFNGHGNIAFGINEYIDIPDIKYDPEIGIMGLEVCITLERAGFRIKKRRKAKKRISKNHEVTKEEAIIFIKDNFKTKVGGEE